METTNTILMYSKYSKYSNTFIELLESSNIDFVKVTGLNIICIDNENIRKRIIDSKNVQIQNVPCILIVYNDGGVEKYEGSDAFKWAEDIIIKNKHPVVNPQIGRQINNRQFNPQLNPHMNPQINPHMNPQINPQMR